MRILLAVAACLCVLCLTSCGGENAVGHSLTPADFSTAQAVQVHQLVVLELPENPSTGFTWHASVTPEAALQLSRDYYLADQPALPGSGGTHYFVYEALASGRAVITVQYGRWWEGGESQDPQTITLNIQ